MKLKNSHNSNITLNIPNVNERIPYFFGFGIVVNLNIIYIIDDTRVAKYIIDFNKDFIIFFIILIFNFS